MNEIQQKRKAVLDEALSYFTPKTRSKATGDFGEATCLYIPSTISEGCAVGRLIKDKALCYHLDNLGGVHTDRVWAALPEDVKELGQDFLRSLQTLHDSDRYWGEDGLSVLGKQRVAYIEINFINNEQ